MQDIRMRAYAERVKEQITDAWNPPPIPGKSLEATALITVDLDGQVTSFALLRRSGNTMLDESLLRAIRQASPLPPLPQDHSGPVPYPIEIRFRPRT
jgi:TonB family protein